MKKILFSFLVLFFVLNSCGGDSKTFKEKDYKKNLKLLWHEEFNQANLDSFVWSQVPVDSSSNDGWRAKLSNNPNLIKINNGILTLYTGLEEDEPKGICIWTLNKKLIPTDTLVVIRAKMNEAKGANPALWLSTPDRKIKWYEAGEIDILEHPNFRPKVYQSVHSSYTKSVSANKPPRTIQTKLDVKTWHDYAVRIKKDELVFYIDGIKTGSYQNINKPDQFPFTSHDWNLILGISLGSKWTGEVEKNDLPAWLSVDFVRVYG